MIVGFVDEDLNPRIEVTVTGRGLRKRSLTAIVDTGFTDFLLLPDGLIAFLQLTELPVQAKAVLADGSEISSPYYEVGILWDGVLRQVPVIGTDGTALIGMSLMRGYDLSISVEEGGAVTLTRKGETAD